MLFFASKSAFSEEEIDTGLLSERELAIAAQDEKPVDERHMRETIASGRWICASG
jgi:hypothetical protein